MKKEDASLKRKADIRALAKFITPVDITIRKPIQPDSLQTYTEFKYRQGVTDEILFRTEKHGVANAQALIYEELLVADLSLIESGSNQSISDKELFLNIEQELNKAGLFNMAKSVKLLAEKVKLVKNVKDVFISKKGKEAANKRYEIETQQEIDELECYKVNLIAWANHTYSEDCEYRISRNLKPRTKRGSPSSANYWLMDMINDDLELDKVDTSILGSDFTDSLTLEGNRHGSPSRPDKMLGFILTPTFFYNALKN